MGKKGPVILVRKETTPDDIHGMDVAKGILTAVGGKSSHAAVVARGMGRPCIVGAGSISISERNKEFTVAVGGKTVKVKEGDWISMDGPAPVFIWARPKPPSPIPTPAVPFAKLMSWADEFRGGFGVRANADIPRDAKAARRVRRRRHRLCRTEHMFFAEDRIPYMQAMILARDEKTRTKALQKLLPMQRKDFAGLFEAMDGFPVVIRTLDPPLHEFLPKREDLMVDLARLPYADAKVKKEISEKYGIPKGELKKRLPELLHRVEELHEFNPMLGHRGCRLGITYPEITEMQARAMFEAVVQVAKKGIKVIPEVMIPLVGSAKELENQRAIVVRVANEVLAKAGMKKLHYMVGTMIEIPRAALTADKIAEQAEFFSFGTNDLTQTTMGLSRDDYTKFSKEYENLKIFKADPFASIDQEGVGKLIEDGDQAGPAREAKPRNRHLRRTRRRPEFGGVLLPRGHELRILLAVSRADRAARGGAGGDLRRQVGHDAHGLRHFSSRAGKGRLAPHRSGRRGLVDLQNDDVAHADSQIELARGRRAAVDKLVAQPQEAVLLVPRKIRVHGRPSTHTRSEAGRCSSAAPAIRPPTITMANGRCESEPMPCEVAAGSRPSVATSMVIMMGRKPRTAPSMAASIDGMAAHAQLVDVLHHDHAHLHRDAEQRQKSDARRDAQVGAAEIQRQQSADRAPWPR
jgi:phosphohistidine swiveling domain-containing protein